MPHLTVLTSLAQTDWSTFYAPGPEIRDYLQSVVDKYKLMRYIKLQHRVVHARYDEPTGKWHLRIRRPRDPSTPPPTSQPPPNLRGQPELEGEAEELYEEFEDTADLLFTGVGSLSRWKWPEIDGLKDFGGKLFHTADFELGDESKPWQEAVREWKDKRVGVIGVVGGDPMKLVYRSVKGDGCIGFERHPDCARAPTQGQEDRELRAGEDVDLDAVLGREDGGAHEAGSRRREL